MKINKILIIICTIAFVSLVFIAESVDAISQNYESATTARIVGDSPAEMEQQLANDNDINLEKAIYVSSQQEFYHYSEVGNILRRIFNRAFDFLLNADLSSLDDKLSGTKDTILIINPSDSSISMKKISELDADEAEQLSGLLGSNDNLVILNSHYAGLYLPNEKSLIASMSPYANIIAPTSFSSKEFLKAIVCNLNNRKTIGELYRQARNNYYWNTQNSNELIGLTLLSYNLYGLPTKNLIVPYNGFISYCSGYQENFGVTFDNPYEITSNLSKFYTKEFEFKINHYEIADIENYSVIIADGMINSENLFELALPKKILVEKFPINTMITNFSVIEFSDPIELNVEKLPINTPFGFDKRVCYETQKNASLLFSRSYSDDNLFVITNINPVEVVDCENGKFRLYRKIKYKIEYVPYSPVMIESVFVPNILAPNQDSEIRVIIRNMTGSKFFGYLVIKDDKGEIISVENATADGEYKLKFKTPAKKGLLKYSVEFYSENESKTYSEFYIDVKTIDISLAIPEVIEDDSKVFVKVFNNLNRTIQAEMEYKITHNNLSNYILSDILPITLKSGDNLFAISLPKLDREKLIYNFYLGILYENNYDSASGYIITEHIPVIKQGNIEINENDSFVLEPEIEDIDGDNVVVDVVYPFPYSVGEWVASFESSGDYYINITADDGIKKSMKTIMLRIKNVNRAPRIDIDDKIIAIENETIRFNPIFSDPDNENSVNNDDNNLTIIYDGIFNNSGDYVLDFDSAGNYTETISVSDGEITTSKTILIEILNKNRPPIINVENISAKEGEFVNLSALIGNLITDPDNENSVSNDDNDVVITYGVPFDELGGWQTNYEDSGEYNVLITASDGELITNKTIIVKILNTNRAPNIIVPEKFVVKENESIKVVVNVTDPDNENSVNNDDNNLTIIYGEPLDNNGEWQPGFFDAGIYSVNVTVSDGEVNVTKQINIEVLNNNRNPIINYTIPESNEVNISENDSVKFSVNAEDLDLEKIDYKWYVNNNFVWEGQTFNFITNFSSAGKYYIKVIVFDINNATDEKIWVINVKNVNIHPVINNADEFVAYEGETIKIIVNATDEDNAELSYSINDSRFISDGNKFIWKTTYDDSGIYYINISVSDGELSTTKTIKLNLINVNRAPQIIGLCEKFYYISNSSSVLLKVNATDFDKEDNLTIKWYVDNIEAGVGEVFRFNSGKIGEFKITAVASDGNLSNHTEFNVRTSDKPILDGFDGATTNFDEIVDLSNVDGFTIEKSGIAKVTFLKPLDLRDSIDFVTTTIFDDKYISINTNKLDALSEIPARITIYNITFENPVIYYANEYGAKSIKSVCPSSVCYNLSIGNNSISFNVVGFSTFFVSRGDRKHLDFNVLNNILITLPKGRTKFSERFLVENNGLSNLDNLRAISVPVENAVFDIEPKRFTLLSGGIQNMVLSGEVLTELQSQETKEIGVVRFENENVNKEIKIYVVQKDMLSIESLDINIDGNIYSVNDGDRLRIKPGSNIVIILKLRNLFSEDNIIIEDIKIDVKINDINNGRSINWESDSFDIGPDEVKKHKISLKIPEILTEDSYLMEIEASGKNSDNNGRNVARANILFKSQRKEHDVKIANVEMSDRELDCNELSELRFDVFNLGKENEKNLKVVVRNKFIGIDEEKIINLKSGDSKRLIFVIDPNRSSEEIMRNTRQNVSISVVFENGKVASNIVEVFNAYSCADLIIQDEKIALNKLNHRNLVLVVFGYIDKIGIINLILICGIIFILILIIVVKISYSTINLKKNKILDYKNEK